MRLNTGKHIFAGNLTGLLIALYYLVFFALAFIYNSITLTAFDSKAGYYLIFFTLAGLPIYTVLQCFNTQQLRVNKCGLFALIVIGLLWLQSILIDEHFAYNYFNLSLIVVVAFSVPFVFVQDTGIKLIDLAKAAFSIIAIAFCLADLTASVFFAGSREYLIPNRNITCMALGISILVLSSFKHRLVFWLQVLLVLLLGFCSWHFSSYMGGVLAVGLFCRLIRRYFTAMRNWAFVLSLILPAFMLFAFTSLNSASFQGRVHILRVTLLHWREFLWHGIGNGQFPVVYPQWQSAYFKNRVAIDKSWLVADDAFSSYSSLATFIVENGLVVFLCCILAFSQFVLASKKMVVPLIWPLFLLVFFYSAESVPLLIALLLYVIDNSAFKLFRFKAGGRIFFAGILLLFILTSLFHTAGLYKATGNWNEAVNVAEFDQEAMASHFNKADPVLASSRNYRLNRAACYFNAGNDKECIAGISGIMTQHKNYSFYLLEGAAYEHLGKWQEALAAYTECTFIIPNRFLPRLKMAQLYLQLGEMEKAKLVIRQALGLPVKIKNARTMAIIDDIKMLDSLYF